MVNKKELNLSRALYYGVLSKFFIHQDDLDTRFFALKEILPILSQNSIDEESGNALKRLSEIFSSDEEEKKLIEEFDEIFYIPDINIVRNTASFYDDGIEGGKKQLEVKKLLFETKIRRNEKYFKETEDSVGFILLFMYELIEYSNKGNNEYENLEYRLFTEILNPFIDSFANDVFNHPCSNHYKDIAIVLNSFMEFERVLFSAPKHKIIKKSNKTILSKSEEDRRAKNRAKKKKIRQELS